MKILTRYLSKTIIIYVLLVMLFLFGLQMFIEFIREFPSLGEGDYGLSQVIIYVLLMLPYDIYQFFPMACLLGSVIALGLLASHSELIVMRASGVSLINIASAVLKAALVLIVIMVLIGEVLSPTAQRHGAKIKTAALSGGRALITYQGMWLRNNSSFFKINSVSNNRELQGITRYQFGPNNQLKTASYAARGVYEKGGWVFSDIVQTEFLADVTTTSKFSEKKWDLAFSPKLIGAAHVDTDQKSLVKLYSYIKYHIKSGLNASNYEFAFWQRVFAPLATLVMILLAIPFVFGPLRSTTMGLRMLLGVMTGFGFYILNQFVGPMSIVYQVPPVLAAILPPLIFALIGGLVLFRAK